MRTEKKHSEHPCKSRNNDEIGNPCQRKKTKVIRNFAKRREPHLEKHEKKQSENEGIDGQCGNSLMVPSPFCSRLAGKMRNRRSAFGMPFPTIRINGTFPTKAEAQPCECSAEVPPRLSIDWIPLLRDFHDLGKSLTKDERSLFTSCLSHLAWDRPYPAKTRHATLCSSI